MSARRCCARGSNATASRNPCDCPVGTGATPPTMSSGSGRSFVTEMPACRWRRPSPGSWRGPIGPSRRSSPVCAGAGPSWRATSCRSGRCWPSAAPSRTSAVRRPSGPCSSAASNGSASIATVRPAGGSSLERRRPPTCSPTSGAIVCAGGARPSWPSRTTPRCCGNGPWCAMHPTPQPCLAGFERPGRRDGAPRSFEAVWSVNPAVVRDAAGIGAALARRRDLTVELPVRGQPATDVSSMMRRATALTNRIVAYLDV